MGIRIECRPLERWPGEFTNPRRTSPFKTTFDGTIRKLKHELAALDAKGVILQVAVTERQISVTTSMPMPEIRPAHPGVILAADTRHGALKWMCDACPPWRANVHAIALTLERLRLADLYGVTRKGEQYLGWKMLPGPITAGAPTMSMEDAARFVAGFGDATAAQLINRRQAWERAYQQAVKILHPDRHKGQVTPGWSKLQEAATLLNSLHNRK
jgi:hypothetical protein